jgi:hypothetical protein
MPRTMKKHVSKDQTVEALTDVGYQQWVGKHYAGRKGQMEGR